tara:strand:+ start:877 stop:3087 length:2211 start_codon:yes stop_codon:yes gene_type:complete
MSKRKRFSEGDTVEWRGGEYIVVSLEPFVVRATAPGRHRDFSPNISSVHLSEDWRAGLKPNDEVEFFFESIWVHSHVHAVDPLVIQPTFTRVLIQSAPHRIRRARCSIPVRFELADGGEYGRFDQVLVDGEWYVVDRCLDGSVLTMDRRYIPFDRVSGSISLPLTRTLIGTVPYQHGTEFSDARSILDSTTRFRDCSRYARHDLWRRRSIDLDQMVGNAYDNGDVEGGKNLTACAEYLQKFETARWFECRWCSIPYLMFEFSQNSVNIYWTHSSPLSPSVMLRYVTPVIAPLFVPNTSVEIISDVSPRLLDWQNPAVDQMVSFEDENVCSLFCDQIVSSAGSLTFSHFTGFMLSQGALPVSYGGVFSAGAGLGKTWMMLDLVRRQGGKTLVVVPLCVLPHWVQTCSDFGIDVSVWHGANKSSSGTVVVSTTRTLSRRVPAVHFERLVLDEAQMVKADSSAMALLCSLDISVRWYVSTCPRFLECCIFLRVYPFSVGFQPDSLCEIPHEVRLDKSIPFEVTHVQAPMRYPSCYGEVDLSRPEMNLLRFDPKLIPREVLHERVRVHKNTLANVQQSLSHPLDIGSCPVCLEQIVDAVVTRCGHALCSECSVKLMDLDSNCPMCRADMYPLTAISDTEETTMVINGRLYRERDLGGGNILEVLSNSAHGKTIYVTRSSTLYNELKNKFCMRLLRECKGVRFDCDTIVLVDNYISETEKQQVLDRARGINSSTVRLVSII